jgi:HK97 family phage prohead protease
MELEKRSIRSRLEVRSSPKGKVVVGYAAVYNSLSEDIGGFKEQISPGAFDNALQRSDVRALINHDPNMLMGRESAGTLKLRSDEKGLKMEISMPDSELARHYVSAIARGDMTGASFSFTVDDDDQAWDDTASGRIRTIRSVRVGPIIETESVSITKAAAHGVAARGAT